MAAGTDSVTLGREDRGLDAVGQAELQAGKSPHSDVLGQCDNAL